MAVSQMYLFYEYFSAGAILLLSISYSPKMWFGARFVIRLLSVMVLVPLVIMNFKFHSFIGGLALSLMYMGALGLSIWKLMDERAWKYFTIPLGNSLDTYFEGVFSGKIPAPTLEELRGNPIYDHLFNDIGYGYQESFNF